MLFRAHVTCWRICITGSISFTSIFHALASLIPSALPRLYAKGYEGQVDDYTR